MKQLDKTKEYYLFSDESGSKMDEYGYYVISWVFIAVEEYTKLITAVKLFKNKNGNKELKFNKNTKYNFLEEIDFSVFITVTSNKYFHNRHFRLFKKMDILELSDTSAFSINKKRFNFRSKIDSAIKNSIFLYLFEFYHIDNILDFIRRKNINIIEIIKDTPQYTDSEYKKVFKKACEENCQDINLNLVKRSEEFPGIELSDLVAGAFRSSLEQNNEFIFKSKLVGEKIIMRDLENLEYINLKSIIESILEQ